MLMPFVVTPVASDSPYSHNTAAPDAIDAYISSIPHPNTSSILTWERYLERVTSGSWGDHVVIALLLMWSMQDQVVSLELRTKAVSIDYACS